jgi:hypothetical protein
MNNNYRGSPQYDILGESDYVYVWSECGLALIVYEGCYIESGQPRCRSLEDYFNPQVPISGSLNLRYPNPFPGLEPLPNASVNDIVLMKFIFPPTSYDGFKRYYMRAIPFGLWDSYLKSVKITK